MATLNKVMLIGRLTNDPEEGALPTGTRVVKFRFAVGRSKKNPATGQWENDPNPLYIDCEAFARQDAKRDLVSLIKQYCHKGDSLYIEGRLQYDQWEDKNGGGKRSKHKLVVENIEFIGGRGENSGAGDEGEGASASSGGRSYGGNSGGSRFSGSGSGTGGARQGGKPSAPPPPPDESGDNGDPIPF